MGRSFSAASEVTSEYRKKYKAFPKLTLARLMHKEHPEVYSSVSNARQSLNYITGKAGKRSRTRAKHIGTRESEIKTPTRAEYALPRTWGKEKKIFTLPSDCNNIGFISDAQVPFQDNIAIEATYEYLKAMKVNTIFINGDWVDFYGLSFFEKDPRKRSFKREYRNILISLEHMRHHFPTANIFYNLDANHEIRYYRKMLSSHKELLELDLPEYSASSLMRLDLFDIVPIQNHHHCMIGKLPVIHGHTIFRGTTSPASTSRTVFMKLAQSAIVSHCHQTNEYVKMRPLKTGRNSEMITCWTTGCLMDLNVEYSQHNNNYNHGFAHITTQTGGEYHVSNKRILNGKVL
jgi:hypothetical protein